MERYIILIDSDTATETQIASFLNSYDIRIKRFPDLNSFTDFQMKNPISQAFMIITEINFTGSLETWQKLSHKKALLKIPVLIVTEITDKNILSSYVGALDALSIDVIEKPLEHKDWFLAKFNNLLNIKYVTHKISHMMTEVIESYGKVSSANYTMINNLENFQKNNDFIFERVFKLIKESDKSVITKQMLNKLFTNDMPIIEAITLFIEHLNKVYYELILEKIGKDEIFTVLPKILEPLETFVADMKQVKEIFLDMNILNEEILKGNNLFNTYFFQEIKKIYESGDISEHFFQQFINIGENKKTDDDMGNTIFML